MMRVENLLNHERFIAKIYSHPSEQQIQSVKNIVQLAKEKEWKVALEPLTVLLEKDAVAIIFRNAEGSTLRQFMQHQKKIKPSEFITVAISLCNMLATLHSSGWILGNLSPDHIFITPEKYQCKVADFRKASRVLKKEIDNPVYFTEVRELDYISPEQTGRINQVIDYRSDYYSLGIVFYEMLTGELPFKSDSAAELLYDHIAKVPPAPNKVDPYLPQVLNDIVLKLLEKIPGKRYQSWQGLMYDLENSIRYFRDENYLQEFNLGQKDFVSRISIPDKLMGRDEVMLIMQDAYQIARSGRKQALYISGSSGVGKSRLVLEFQRIHLDASTFITKAKFDILQRNAPYSAMVTAVRDLIRNLLRIEESKLNYWKKRLLDYLKGNGKIIINVVPELEIVIGEQPAPVELPPDESQNRFQQTFLNFIAAFSTGEYCLILFLDDLQWADLASIKLIELIVMNVENKNFLFIGVYRDSEVEPTHPLYTSLQRQEKRVDVKEVKLLPLEKEIIRAFISETLQHKVEKSDALTEKIYQKTQGNIFFTIQLLTSLNDAGLLVNDENGVWKWDVKALEDYDIAGNVVDLLVQKINSLGQLKKEILRTAACIGDIFDLFTTASLTGERLYTIANELSFVINMGYLITKDNNLDYYIRSSENISDDEFNSAGNVRFQFAHDRIRHACLTLVTDDEMALINLRAGQFKIKHYSQAEIDDDIFFIANHFNKGRKFIKEETDLNQLVKINFQAGKKAKEATAYDAAIEYFNLGREFLNFKDHYNQLNDFYLQGATCKYLAGQYSEAEKDLDELLSYSQTRLDKLEVLMLKVYMYTTKDEKEKAVEAGRIGFRLYGLIMPRVLPVTMFVVLKDIIKARWLLRGKRLEDIPRRTVLHDPERIRFLEFTLAVSPPIYQYDQNLFAWDVMKMVSYSLRYGNNGIASFGYMGFGMILAQMLGTYKTGKKLADVGITINRQLGYTALKWKIGMSYHNFVAHWTMPVRPEFDNMQEIINGCIANGDPIYAGYGIFHFHQKKFALGFPLLSVQQSFEDYMKLVDQRGDKETRHFLEGYYYAVRCLRGEEENIAFMGQQFNAPARLEEIVASFSFSVAADTYIAYINILYQFQYDIEAWQRYTESCKYVNFIYHRYEYSEYAFYGGLICARAFEKKLSPQRPYLKMLKTHLKKLKNWSVNCPDNFEPQYFLLKAELARITGKTNEAATLYESAIKSAEKYLFVNYKALASELAGRYYFSSGNITVAKAYLENARRFFLQWGAFAKVKHLEKEFGLLLGSSLLENKKNKEPVSMENVDVGYLLNVSRAVSSIKDVDKVIEQLMLAVIQNSGADTGYLLIRNRADLVIKSSYKIAEGVRLISEYIDPEMLPLNTIRYVARVKDPLIINNPASSTEYNAIPYFAHNYPLSVLIYPVLKQNELFGILYLENYLIEDVFDAKRVELLNLISGQIAMLLDNNYLYQNLEIIVKERTIELETEKEQMSELLKNIFPKEAIAELKATGKTTPQRLDNVTVLMADIKGFTEISERLSPEELIGMIDSFFRAFDEIMGKYGLEKIKTIGDAYMAIGGIGKTLYDGAQKIVQAALDMQKFVEKQAAQLKKEDQVELRTGIHSGSVIAGVVGIKKLQYDIWGDTVNVAARMEQNSAPGRVNISTATYQLVKDHFTCTYRGKVEAKNKGEMDMYFVEDV